MRVENQKAKRGLTAEVNSALAQSSRALLVMRVKNEIEDIR